MNKHGYLLAVFIFRWDRHCRRMESSMPWRLIIDKDESKGESLRMNLTTCGQLLLEWWLCYACMFVCEIIKKGRRKKWDRLSIPPEVTNEKKKRNKYNGKENICQANTRRREREREKRARIHFLISISCVTCHYLTIVALPRFQVYTRWIVSTVSRDRTAVRLHSNDAQRMRYHYYRLCNP